MGVMAGLEAALKTSASPNFHPRVRNRHPVLRGLADNLANPVDPIRR
jgi:hypothetical protein